MIYIIMTILISALKFFSFCCDKWQNIRDMAYERFKDIEMEVLNGTFTEVYFYDFLHMEKHTLRNNSSLFNLSYLYIKSKWFGYNILDDVCIEEFFSPFMFEPTMGVFEVVYFQDRQTFRYYAKGDHMNKEEIHGHILTNCFDKKLPKALYATLSDKYNATPFINEHMASFFEENGLSVYDVAMVLLINKHKIPPIGSGYYLTIVDDETLAEKTFKDKDVLVLV